ncbi:MAG: PilW family protein [Candidatus Omnitrophota bacterium]
MLIHRRGITLIQMMISCAMLAVLTAAFSDIVFVTWRNWNYQNQRLELREPAIWAMENISQDLRRARSITLADASRITFSVSPYESIDYNRVLSGGVWQLVRTQTLTTLPVTTNTATMGKNVSAFTLQYYDSSGGSIAAPIGSQAQRDNVRLVRITLSMQSTLLSNTETVTLRTQIRPRNL